MECEICKAAKRADAQYCNDCQQAPILRRLWEERHPAPTEKHTKKSWWR